MILIGSRALSLRAPQALRRAPLDFDWIATQQEAESWIAANAIKIGMTKSYHREVSSERGSDKLIAEGKTNVEFELVRSGTSSEMLCSLVQQDPETLDTPFGKVPSFDLLFTLKSSHKYVKFDDSRYSLFWKTSLDYHVMQRLGAKVRPEYQEFLKLREKETYWYKHPKLNVGKDAFFQDDGIDYRFDHDDIHQSVARGERPAYTYYLKDGAPVDCDKNKFFALPQQVRLNGVIEEASVLAIERSLVPHPGIWTPEYAWRYALSKVCTSITSGWFRKFAFDNLPEVVKLYPTGYWDKFQADCQAGKVKPFTGRTY